MGTIGEEGVIAFLSLVVGYVVGPPQNMSPAALLLQKTVQNSRLQASLLGFPES